MTWAASNSKLQEGIPRSDVLSEIAEHVRILQFLPDDVIMSAEKAAISIHAGNMSVHPTKD